MKRQSRPRFHKPPMRPAMFRESASTKEKVVRTQIFARSSSFGGTGRWSNISASSFMNSVVIPLEASVKDANIKVQACKTLAYVRGSKLGAEDAGKRPNNP